MKNREIQKILKGTIFAAALSAGLCAAMPAMALAAEAETTEVAEAETTEAAEAETAESADAVALEDVTVEAMVAANSLEAVLENYDSILYDSNEGYLRYASADGQYVEGYGEDHMIQGNIGYGIMEDGTYYGIVFTDNYLEDPYYGGFYEYIAIDGETTSQEELQDVTDNGDGTYTMTTLLTAEKLAEYAGEDSGYPEGSYAEVVYILDAATLAAQDGGSETVYDADGNEINKIEYTISYNVEEPEGMKELEERLADTENLRTLHVIAEPGTDQEKTYTAYAQNGEGIAIRTGSGTSVEIYTDEACTELLESTSEEDRVGEQTVYVKYVEVDTEEQTETAETAETEQES